MCQTIFGLKTTCIYWEKNENFTTVGMLKNLTYRKNINKRKFSKYTFCVQNEWITYSVSYTETEVKDLPFLYIHIYFFNSISKNSQKLVHQSLFFK